jgi:pyruvate carboxylase
MPATTALPRDMAEVARLARGIGYPVMVKASWGGGGRGVRAIAREEDLEPLVESARREAAAAFGDDEAYLEKLVRHARHVKVQILADVYGNVVYLHERDCSVQRRHQKVIERSPAPYLSDEQRGRLCGYALAIAREAGYRTPARSSSCRTPTPATSISSRSTRASRSSTPSPNA